MPRATAAGFDNPHFGAIAEWDETQGWNHIRIPSQDAADVSDDLKIRYPDPQAKIAVRTLIPGFAVQELANGLGQLTATALMTLAVSQGWGVEDVHKELVRLKLV